MLELVIALLFEFFGPFIIAGLIIWGAVVLWRIVREARSRKAMAGDETARDMEQTRTAAWFMGVAGILSYPVVFIMALLAGAGFDVSILIAVVVGSFIALLSRFLRNKYNRSFKENIVASELHKIFDNLEYLPEGRLNDTHIRDTGFFKSQSHLDGDDFIEADYRGKHFAQCDLVVEERYTVSTGSGSSSTERWRDVFRGRMMRFDLAAAFRGAVQVVKWNFDAARVVSSPGDWKPVETELHDFNKTFKAFARDPMDVMAVLTPQMVEAIFRLDRQLDRPLGLLFIDRCIYAFFPSSRDAFDVSGKAKMTLLEERDLVRADISAVTEFLEAMEYGMRDYRTLLDQIKTSAPAEAAGGVAVDTAEGAPPVESAPSREPPPPLPERRFARSEEASSSFGNYNQKTLLLRLWRNPALIVLAGYFVSVVYILIKLPDGIGVGIHIIGDDVAVSQIVPTIAFAAVASVFITAAAVSVGQGPWTKNLGKLAVLAILLCIYYFFVSSNLAAQGGL